MVGKIINKVTRRMRRYEIARFEAPFRKLILEDRKWVDPIFKKDTTLLPQAHFVEMYLSQLVYEHDTYREFCGCVIKKPWIKDGVLQCHYPVGANENRRKAIERILRIYGSECRQVVFWATPDDGVQELKNQFGDHVTKVDDWRDGACYILDLKEQTELAGAEFRNKRKKIVRFHKNYNMTSEPITAENMDECMAVNEIWLKNRTGNDLWIEQKMMKRALDEMDALGLQGVLFRIDGEPAAFYIGTPFNDNVYFSMFIKSDNRYQDISLAATHEFFKMNCQGFEYDNEDCDGGVPGLRDFKMNLHPKFMVPYYFVTVDFDR